MHAAEAHGANGSSRDPIEDPKTIPRREWLYGRHYIRKYLSTTIAPGGVGKSALLTVFGDEELTRY
jgi:hypothetical protein